MSKKISKFHFKQFSVSHHRSSMKVGVDGVLIGCWADTKGARRILDVGTGCGLIALILAQRSPEAIIDAIDIDAPSVVEAQENISASPWASRIRAELCNYSDIRSRLSGNNYGYDLIVSNPPYYDSGVTETLTAREKARHQGELSPLSLLRGARYILNSGGSVAMVIPTENADTLVTQASGIGFRLIRKCLVRGHENAPYKRSLLQWGITKEESIDDTVEEVLTLEISPGNPTDDYRNLCKDFYLRF